MVNAISGSGAPYTAPTSTPSASTTASAPGDAAQSATPAPTAPRVNVPEDPSTWTWEHRQENVASWLDTLLSHFTVAVQMASEEGLKREAQNMRESGYSEEQIAKWQEIDKGHAQQAEVTLVNAKESFEQIGFKVTGTMYEKGADGEWHMGQFTLDRTRAGCVLHYDSSSGLTVTPDTGTTGTTGGGPAAATDTAKAAAVVKAADVKDIYDKAQAQVDQYRKLFDKVLVAADRLREASYNDPQAEAELTAARKEVSDFQFGPWDDRLRTIGITLGQPLIGRDSSGLPVIGARMMNTVVDGLNLNLQFDGKGGAWYRHEGSDGWQEWDDQKVADARTLLQQALTQPVDLVA